MAALHVTKDNFQSEILNSNVPVLVDFSASWCGPCRHMAPVVDELSEEMAGKAKVAKLDVDECNDIARKYGVMSVPTFMVFKNGEVVAKNMGAMPKQRLSTMLDKAL